MKQNFSFILILTLLAVPLSPVLAQSHAEAHSAPMTMIAVNTTVDEFGTGSDCSLREAIQAANSASAFGGCVAGSGDDVIQLPAGIYILTLAGSGENSNATGDLDLGGNITFNGADQATTVIDGNALDRILDIHYGTVVLNDITITGGLLPTGPDGVPDPTPGGYGGTGEDGEPGGGIRNAGDLTLTRCTVSSNQAGQGGNGGPGTPGLDGTNPGDNGTDGGGGGWGGNGGHGGGIYNLSGAILHLDHSTVLDNVSGMGGDGNDGGSGGDGNGDGQGGDGGEGGDSGEGGDGGGVYNADGATLTSEYSLIRNNLSGIAGVPGNGGNGGDGSGSGSAGYGGDGGYGGEPGDGGGVANEGSATFSHTTISHNRTADGAPGGNGGAGGKGYMGDVGGHGGDGGSGGEGNYSGDGGGIYHNSDVKLTFDSGIISYNQTGRGGDGGPGGPGGNGVSGTATGEGGDGGDGGYGNDGFGSGYGGGIAGYDSVDIFNSVISENQTGPGGNGASGGQGGDGGNGTSGGDGGTGGDGDYGDGGGPGGGLYVRYLRLESSTVINNRTGSGGSGGDGGPGGHGGAGETGGIGGEGGEGGYGQQGGSGGAGGGISGSGNAYGIDNSTIQGNITGNGGQGGVGGPGGNGGQGTGLPGPNGDGGSGGYGGYGGDGAGIYSNYSNDLELDNSTISNNFCGHGGSGGMGGDSGAGGDPATGTGGDGDNGTRGGQGCGLSVNRLLLTNSTISGNAGGGGGVGGDGGDATPGGGIYVPTSAIVFVANSTIAENISLRSGGAAGSGYPNGTDGIGGEGGGVYTSGVFSFTHTIIANNQSAFKGPDCNGTLDSLNYNLIERTNSCVITGSTGRNIYNVDPDLAPLDDNGGPTDTQLPQPGSIVLDRGSTACRDTDGDPLTSDQRGYIRPVDIDENGTASCDIGAVEVQGYRQLSVNIAGQGSGSVNSIPLGIDCGYGRYDCTEPYDLNTVITLTVRATISSTFAGWSGDCIGVDLSCAVTMDLTRSVTATFDLIPTHTVSIDLTGEGAGKVSSTPDGIDCGDGGVDCSAVFYEGTTLILTAISGTNSTFSGWTGDVSGIDNPIQVMIDVSKNIEANFALNEQSIYLPLLMK